MALYQGSLRGKTKQLKAMASELNMAQAQVGGAQRGVCCCGAAALGPRRQGRSLGVRPLCRSRSVLGR